MRFSLPLIIILHTHVVFAFDFSIGKAYEYVKGKTQEVISQSTETYNELRYGQGFFDPTPLQAYAEETKQAIRLKKQENSNLYHSNDGLVGEQALAQEKNRSESCSIISQLKDELFNRLTVNCKLEIAQTICSQSFETIKAVAEDTKSTPISRDIGLVHTLKTFYKNNLQALKNAQSLNNQCSTQIKATAGSSDCLDTYQTVFNEGMQNLIANDCAESSVDNVVSVFAETMRDPDSPPKVLLDISVNHSLARKYEFDVMKTLIEVRNTLNDLENPSRSPTAALDPSEEVKGQ